MPKIRIARAILDLLDADPVLDDLCRQVYARRTPLYVEDLVNPPPDAYNLLLWRCPGIRWYRARDEKGGIDSRTGFCPNRFSIPRVYEVLSERYGRK
jgi:hypothetical protein